MKIYIIPNTGVVFPIDLLLSICYNAGYRMVHSHHSTYADIIASNFLIRPDAIFSARYKIKLLPYLLTYSSNYITQ